MIDRTYRNPPLTAKWLKVAFLISGGLFAFLIALTFVFWLVGVLGWIGCWLWIGLAYLVCYLLALLPALAALGIMGAASDSNGDNGAGCAGFLLVIGLIWFYDSWTWFSTLTDEAASVRVKTSVWADDAYSALYVVAADTWDVFVANEVYLWSWVVLTAAVGVTFAYLGTLLLARADAPMRRVTRAVRFQCPRCAARALVHRCPKCSSKHADVAPTRHGIWTANCDRCPTPLGTTGWTGLLSLPRECASCGHELSHPHLGWLPEYHVALIGGRASGKTTLAMAAVEFVENNFGPTHGLKVTFEGSAAERDIRNKLHLLGTGEPQRPTPLSERPTATVFSVKPTGGGGGFLLYLYDASGEDLEAGDSGGRPGVSGHDFHDFIDGAILVVDPTSEEGLRSKAGVAARGGRGAEEVLSRMIHFWQRRRRVSAGGRFRFPLAVVVTKMDAGSLAADGGGYPDLTRRTASATALASAATSTSASVRQLLASAGENDLLQLAESHFRSVQYFGVTAQGRAFAAGNRSAFRSQGVYAPFAWLLVECGAITAAPAPVRAARRSAWYFIRCLRGVEGSRMRGLAWTAVTIAALFPVAVIWWYLGLTWAIVGLVLAVAGLTYQSYRTRETG